ncbi:SMP-30/gluconolactonase/LRE family protein [Glaciecola sp. MH2013]|uniref:SMP-30/gluconolactonase/LRE family protein n=1 Tax=Glaciecola sp. MH2013 TaxID=2785524 RepID=UPI0018A0A9AD|nr:SMP-30/gluconolactonase/LRE family protein [Glaciecola sp. MH2013]MBF7074224.1 SMP-30/gluconolactonase/LRE family protein [Glaciecola sp. MH2013]
MNTKQSSVGQLLFSIPSQSVLGECALWHVQEQAIYWVDILAAKIQRYFPATKQLESFELPHRIGCFAFTEVEGDIIAAFDIGIARYSLLNGDLRWLAQPEMHLRLNRFNDGRSDRQGRFWAGTMCEQDDLSLPTTTPGSLYCLASAGEKPVRAISDVLISNGLCWSKDGTTMYHADSVKQSIYAFDFDTRSATISNKREFAITTGHCFPDGATVDSDDHLWNAQWGASQVLRYKPDGSIDIVLKTPVSQPSSVAIGGPDMDWLIVTTAKHSLSAEALANEPQSGDVFVYQLNAVKGIEEPKCKL